MFLLTILFLSTMFGKTSLAEVNANEFSQYVTQFQEASKQYGPLNLQDRGKFVKISKLTVKFGKKEENELGRCEWANGVPTVVMDYEAWNEKPDRQEMVIFHEFGHCVLDRDHCEGVNRDGIPKSIMAAVNFDSAIYYANRDYYLSELFFDPKKKCEVPAPMNKTFATELDILTRRLNGGFR
jgi:hypothetical protein